MKLTQHDIATIEQAHDYLLDKSKVRFSTPLMERLRELSRRIYDKMEDVKDPVFVLSKKEIQEACKEPEKLKEFAKEAFDIELKAGKWYKIEYLGRSSHIYITEIITKIHFKVFGFYSSGDFFEEEDGVINSGAVFSEPDSSKIISLFKKEASKKGYIKYNSDHHLSFNNGCIYRIDNKVVFKNGIWLNQDNDINNLIKESKKLEKKHGLKITLTFE